MGIALGTINLQKIIVLRLCSDKLIAVYCAVIQYCFDIITAVYCAVILCCFDILNAVYCVVIQCSFDMLTAVYCAVILCCFDILTAVYCAVILCSFDILTAVLMAEYFSFSLVHAAVSIKNETVMKQHPARFRLCKSHFLKIVILFHVRTCQPIKRNRPCRWKHWASLKHRTLFTGQRGNTSQEYTIFINTVETASNFANCFEF
jgi:hypothetical protein